MKTYSPTKESVKRDWYVLDLKGKTLGRAASEVAKILCGKNKPIYSPHIDTGDFIVVVNADKVHVTGNKVEAKVYSRHSGYPGGLRQETLKEVLKSHPERVLEMAVRGMLPKNKLRSPRMKRLKVYCSEQHPHQAQRPVELSI